MQEQETVVFYDIIQDKLRNKVAEKCRDYGLSRAQYDCYRGKLPKQKHQELIEKINAVIGDAKVNLFIISVCAKCAQDIYIVDNKRKSIKKDQPREIHFGMKLNRFYFRDYDND
jgi:CRISPR-associated protein Cas2